MPSPDHPSALSDADLAAIDARHGEWLAAKGFTADTLPVALRSIVDVPRLLADVHRLRAELRWYADPQNWRPDGTAMDEVPMGSYQHERMEPVLDRGARARDALGLKAAGLVSHGIGRLEPRNREAPLVPVILTLTLEEMAGYREGNA